MEALWTAAAEPLQAAGLTVYRAMGPGTAARIRAAQVALQLRRCTLEGRPRYLGLTLSGGELLELYAHRMTAELEARAYGPASGGAAGAEKTAQQAAAAWLTGIPGVALRQVETGAADYDPALDCFVCPVTAQAEAWVYATPGSDGLYFEDFILRGQLRQPQRQEGTE